MFKKALNFTDVVFESEVVVANLSFACLEVRGQTSLKHVDSSDEVLETLLLVAF